MQLSTIGAPELAAVVDEEVTPLAAELAHTMRHLDQDSLLEEVSRTIERFAGARDKREALRALVAAGLTVLAALPGTTALYQTASKTRPVRISGEEYDAFRLGRLRHVVFSRGTYDEPGEGDVLQLLERTSERGLTGRDALAEVLFVSRGSTAKGDTYFIVSLRPWRGAGTDSAAQAVLHERRRLLETSIASLRKLSAATTPALSPLVDQTLSSVTTALERALNLCGAPVRQAGQTSTRVSSSPSGQDGNVIVPPAKVSTIQRR